MDKKIGMISLGCAKNRVDTEIMLGHLQKAGYQLTGEAEEAEVIIINTCGFITAAKEESINAIFDAVRLKETGRCARIVVTGCLAQRYATELLEEVPEIDGIMGTGSVPEIVSTVNKVLTGERPVLVGTPGYIHHGKEPRILTTPRHTAYLKIAEGCENRCSYCAIPTIRGPYRSRPMEEIIEEAKELCLRGTKELIVVAQETTRYGIDLYGGYQLANLLQGLERIENCRWIRLMYCYPTTITGELLELIKSSPKICRYIDLPLQHINNRILKMMNRRGSKEHITYLISKLRRMMPGITLRTTFIVGFPGETEAEFNELLSFIEQTRFDRAGIFGYSPEEGTAAEKLPGRISDPEIAARVEAAMELQQDISAQNNRKFIDAEKTVLAEGWDNDANMYWGRSEGDAPEIDGKVFFASEELVRAGDFVKVKILDSTEYDLSGVRTK
ncbi:SSU ribosomal protein S12P methylthiotransferase [Desulfotomaculum arcticum]|uniref:Ribosomal protein uS12 methylthiotransferase RimO n=1 Tax=Desulfotruncus arcticus DSM 17038 TaxID=1121424 RepID=A0A1I2SAI7_9FIRM|nr:30S ribosomal protein S12 methylthiotransferase RimO [Desulfotruncus arcticus]SFG48689.1 SSU ribosomal protein S12P methylthiotransferase [Desulfotomaculum arcticum] [Desulfotruncus arcticus DSM 17038]